ncbi:MAG: NADH-quinone oxidoreductase subunit NuoK [Armatimonadetes bacterium CG07_land_8_20_14_0_80_40_9]|nr:MAG: NADH-quinone oxidoreductase subunit NuoK [Armatimonadetes bacterium CG07_land_8_20_14_0_80_40_9]
MVNLYYYLILSAVLFCIGIYGVLTRRNAVGILMSIELMLNAANINLVAFCCFVTPTHLKGQVFALFVMTVAAAEACVGLALILAIYRQRETILMDKIDLMKW